MLTTACSVRRNQNTVLLQVVTFGLQLTNNTASQQKLMAQNIPLAIFSRVQGGRSWPLTMTAIGPAQNLKSPVPDQA